VAAESHSKEKVTRDSMLLAAGNMAVLPVVVHMVEGKMELESRMDKTFQRLEGIVMNLKALEVM